MTDWIPSTYNLEQEVQSEKNILGSLSLPQIKWKGDSGGFSLPNPADWFVGVNPNPLAQVATAPFYGTPEVKQNLLSQLQSSSNPLWEASPWNPQGILSPTGALGKGYEEWEVPTWHTGVNMPEVLGGEEIAPSVKTGVELAADIPLFMAGGSAASAGIKAIKGASTGAKVARGALKYGLGGTETKATKPLYTATRAAEEAATQGAAKERPAVVNKLIKYVDELDLERKSLDVRRGTDFATRQTRAQAAKDFVLQQGGNIDDANRAFGNQLRGEYEKGITNAADFFTEADGLELRTLLEEGGKKVGISPTKLFDMGNAMSKWLSPAKVMPRPFEINLMRLSLGDDVVNTLIKMSNTIERSKWRRIMDVMNFPKASMSSLDNSGLLRQNLFTVPYRAITSPRQTWKAIGDSWKMLLGKNGQKLYDDLYDDIWKTLKAEPRIVGDMKVEITEKVTSDAAVKALSRYEEPFLSSFANKVPWIKRSNLAYSYIANKMRVDEATDLLRRLDKWALQNNRELTTDIYELAGKLINTSTGRGSIEWLNKLVGGEVGPFFNAILFSPRTFMARIQYPYYSVQAMIKNPVLRQEYAKRWATTLALGISTLGILDGSGLASVSFDPRSADFGKIKVGKGTRIDLWGGYVQQLRFLVQLFGGHAKSTKTGEVYKVNAWDVVERFIQSKESPAIGIPAQLLGREEYYGTTPKEAKSLASYILGGDGQPDWTPEGVGKGVYNTFAPLFLQDLLAALVDEGVYGGLYAAPGSIGVGVQTYGVNDATQPDSQGIKWQDNSGGLPEIKWKDNEPTGSYPTIKWK